MKPKTIKRVFAVLFMVSFLFSFVSTSFASGDVFDFEKFSSSVSGNAEADAITKNAMGTAIQVIRIVATGVAIIMLSYIAIRYLMAAPNEKAEFKKSATIYIVGAVLVFAAGNILGVIVDFTAANIKPA